MSTKRYKFELEITEGNDEFWEGIAEKSGCDEVQELVERALETMGFYPDDNCKLKLTEFNNK